MSARSATCLLWVFATMVSALGLTGCSTEGPAGPKLTGNITGFVYLVNADGSQPTLKDSVTVTVEGTSVSTTTDSAGEWTLNAMQTGIYTIVFSKAGYGASKINQFQFTGGGDKTVGTVYLCAAPAFGVTRLWVRMGALQQQFLGVDVGDTAINAFSKVMIFFGHDSLVSSDPARYSYAASENVKLAGGIDSTDIKLQNATTATAGFASGDTAWAVAYASNAGNNSSGYLDPSTGHTVYTSLNPSKSNVVQIIVP